MGKFESRQEMSRSKYLIVASCAAIAMFLGALTVGAKLNPLSPAGKWPVASQTYPIPAKENGHNSPIVGRQGTESGVGLPVQPHNTLSNVNDWAKKALSTNPINLQVRVGLTQATTQVNAFGVNANLPIAIDTLGAATEPLNNENSSPPSSSTPPGDADNPNAPSADPSGNPPASDVPGVEPNAPNLIAPQANDQPSLLSTDLSADLGLNSTP